MSIGSAIGQIIDLAIGLLYASVIFSCGMLVGIGLVGCLSSKSKSVKNIGKRIGKTIIKDAMTKWIINNAITYLVTDNQQVPDNILTNNQLDKELDKKDENNESILDNEVQEETDDGSNDESNE